MASYLDGKLKRIVAKSFHGKLSKGTIRRETQSSLDSYGDPIAGTPLTFTFEGIRESFDAVYAARAGFPITDVKILILLGTVKPETLPRQGDKVYVDKPFFKWHLVRQVLSVDPAGASTSLQATEIATP